MAVLAFVTFLVADAFPVANFLLAGSSAERSISEETSRSSIGGERSIAVEGERSTVARGLGVLEVTLGREAGFFGGLPLFFGVGSMAVLFGVDSVAVTEAFFARVFFGGSATETSGADLFSISFTISLVWLLDGVSDSDFLATLFGGMESSF